MAVPKFQRQSLCLAGALPNGIINKRLITKTTLGGKSFFKTCKIRGKNSFFAII
jgi:hypothetical protein